MKRVFTLVCFVMCWMYLFERTKAGVHKLFQCGDTISGWLSGTRSQSLYF